MEDGSAQTLVDTSGEEEVAAWSANQAKLTWVTDRNGPAGEIWIRLPDGSERSAVTAADFPAGTEKWFYSPSLSPDGAAASCLLIIAALVSWDWY